MAYAADYSTDPGGYNVSREILDQQVTLVRYFDTTVNNLASGSYYKLFAVPAKFMCEAIYIVVETGEGATETIDITDDDSATTTFVDDCSVETAGTVTKSTADKYYASAGYITLLANNDLTAAQFWVVVLGQVLNTNM